MNCKCGSTSTELIGVQRTKTDITYNVYNCLSPKCLTTFYIKNEQRKIDTQQTTALRQQSERKAL